MFCLNLRLVFAIIMLIGGVMAKKVSCRVIKSVSLGEDRSTDFGHSSGAHNDTINNAIVLAVKVRGINDSVGGKGFKWPFYATEGRFFGNTAIGQTIDCYA